MKKIKSNFFISQKKGFTLIELLVVIAIIGVLASVVMVSTGTARSKSLDTQRKSDLIQIKNALELYYSTCGTYIVRQNCTGTFYGSSSGIGWFNYGSYTGSAGSVAQGLIDNNVTKGIFIDPTKTAAGQFAYMIYADNNHYTVWATIKNYTTQDTDTLNTCYFSQYDNYYSISNPSSTPSQNYCVSN